MANINDFNNTPNIDLNDDDEKKLENRTENRTNKGYSRMVAKMKFMGFGDIDFINVLNNVDINELIDFLITAKSDGKDTKGIINDIINLKEDDEKWTETDKYRENRNKKIDALVASYSLLKYAEIDKNKKNPEQTKSTPTKSTEEILAEENIQLG